MARPVREEGAQRLRLREAADIHVALVAAAHVAVIHAGVGRVVHHVVVVVPGVVHGGDGSRFKDGTGSVVVAAAFPDSRYRVAAKEVVKDELVYQMRKTTRSQLNG